MTECHSCIPKTKVAIQSPLCWDNFSFLYENSLLFLPFFPGFIILAHLLQAFFHCKGQTHHPLPPHPTPHPRHLLSQVSSHMSFAGRSEFFWLQVLYSLDSWLRKEGIFRGSTFFFMLSGRDLILGLRNPRTSTCTFRFRIITRTAGSAEKEASEYPLSQLSPEFLLFFCVW